MVVGFQERNFGFDKFQIFRLMEVDKLTLPELLCVDGGPAEIVGRDLLLPLVECTEFLVVAVKLLPESVKGGFNVLVNPDSVGKLGNNVKGVDHGEVVHAFLVFHQALEEHHDNADNFLLIVVVKHLGNVLNNVKVVVREPLNSEIVGGQDPKDADHIVGNLIILKAVSGKPLVQLIETIALLNKKSSQSITLG